MNLWRCNNTIWFEFHSDVSQSGYLWKLKWNEIPQTITKLYLKCSGLNHNLGGSGGACAGEKQIITLNFPDMVTRWQSSHNSVTLWPKQHRTMFICQSLPHVDEAVLLSPSEHAPKDYILWANCSKRLSWREVRLPKASPGRAQQDEIV